MPESFPISKHYRNWALSYNWEVTASMLWFNPERSERSILSLKISYEGVFKTPP